MACVRLLLQWTFCCVMPAVVPLTATASLSMSWPTETVRIVFPYPAGSEPDLIARDLGGQIRRESGKQFLIENRPGSNSISGPAEVVDGANDGSVLLLVDRRGTVANSLLYKSIPYDWTRSLKPGTDVASASLFMAVRRNSGDTPSGIRRPQETLPIHGAERGRVCPERDAGPHERRQRLPTKALSRHWTRCELMDSL